MAVAGEQGPRSVTAILLEYVTSITSWRRTAIAMVLGTFSLLVVLTYQQPERLFELVSAAVHSRAVTRDEHAPYMTPLWSETDRALGTLLETYAPLMIGITGWRIDLAANTMLLQAHRELPAYAAAVKDIIKARWRYPVAVFGDDPIVNHVFGQLYTGRFICGHPPQAWPSLARFPIVEVCLVPVPPEGYALSGMLAAAFTEELTDYERTRFEASMRDAAASLVWRPRTR